MSIILKAFPNINQPNSLFKNFIAAKPPEKRVSENPFFFAGWNNIPLKELKNYIPSVASQGDLETQRKLYTDRLLPLFYSLQSYAKSIQSQFPALKEFRFNALNFYNSQGELVPLISLCDYQNYIARLQAAISNLSTITKDEVFFIDTEGLQFQDLIVPDAWKNYQTDFFDGLDESIVSAISDKFDFSIEILKKVLNKIKKKLPPFFFLPIPNIEKGLLGSIFLSQAFLAHIMPIALTKKIANADGYELSPIGFTAHDWQHAEDHMMHILKMLSEYALDLFVELKASSHLSEEALFEKITDYVTKRYRMIIAALQNNLTQVRCALLDNDPELYKKFSVGAFLLCHENEDNFNLDMFKANSYEKVIALFGAQNNDLNEKLIESVKKFKTSVLNGETNLSDQEIHDLFFKTPMFTEDLSEDPLLKGAELSNFPYEVVRTREVITINVAIKDFLHSKDDEFWKNYFLESIFPEGTSFTNIKIRREENMMYFILSGENTTVEHKYDLSEIENQFIPFEIVTLYALRVQILNIASFLNDSGFEIDEVDFSKIKNSEEANKMFENFLPSVIKLSEDSEKIFRDEMLKVATSDWQKTFNAQLKKLDDDFKDSIAIISSSTATSATISSIDEAV